MNTENNDHRRAAWSVLEPYYQEGWARSIGVSNFNEHHLEELTRHAAIPPMLCQTEASIYLRYDGEMNYCEEHGIVREAFSPLGRDSAGITQDATVLTVAEQYQKSAAQIALRFLIQLGLAVTFMSAIADHIRSNTDLFTFELDAEDMVLLDALKQEQRSWGLPSPYSFRGVCGVDGNDSSRSLRSKHIPGWHPVGFVIPSLFSCEGGNNTRIAGRPVAAVTSDRNPEWQIAAGARFTFVLRPDAEVW